MEGHALTISTQPAALDVALTESRSLRSQHMARTDVLDKVKAVSLLSDDTHATTEIVASYYEVTVEALQKVVQRNREELAENGLLTLKGDDLRKLKMDNLSIANARSLTVFTRRTMLNLGQLLTNSGVAKAVRTYLLNVEELAAPSVRTDAIRMAEEATARLRMLGVGAETGLLDRTWATAKARVIAARAMGEEPEIPLADQPLYVPDYIKSKGVTKRKDVASVQSWFGRRVAEAAKAAGAELPLMRDSDLPNGQVRKTLAWTQRHLHLFEEVWDRYYAADYDDRAAVLV